MRMPGFKVALGRKCRGFPGISLCLVARGTLQRYDVALDVSLARKRRQRVDRFLAPFGDHALVAEPELEGKQLADVRGRGVSVGKALVHESFEALETVAVMF